MDFSGFNMLPASERLLIQRHVGPYPSDSPLTAKNRWLKKASLIRDTIDMNRRVDKETGGNISRAVGVLFSCFLSMQDRGAAQPKAVGEILKHGKRPR